jgi:ech hydrogenase subunit A
MNWEPVILGLLILVPVLGGLASLLQRNPRNIRWAVGVTALIVSVSSLVLFGYMVTNNITVLETSAEGIPYMEQTILLLGYVPSIAFLYFGLKLRSPLVLALAVIELCTYTAIPLLSGFRSAVPLMLVDNLSVTVALIASLVGSVIAIYALRYMRQDARQPAFFAAILLFIGAMNGAVFSNDMLLLLLFWELTTLCSFLLIGHTRTPEALAAAKRALEISLLGAVAFIFGIGLAYHYFGSVSIRDIPLTGLAGLSFLPLALFAVAAFTKSAQVPFQSWLLGAMVAPTPVSALLHSSTMVNLGAYFLIRLSPNLASTGYLNWAIALVGGLSFLVSTTLAMTQENSKRVLAWSTIGNLGLIVMCVGVATPLAITAAVILLLYHAISKALMFLAVGVFKEERHSEDIEDMQGLRRTMPFVSLAMFIGVITIVLPPFGMFVSKWLISEAVTTFPFLVFLIGIGFAGIVIVYAKWIGTILSAPMAGEAVALRDDPTPRVYKWTLGALMGSALVLSVLIGQVLHYLVGPFISRHFSLPVFTDNLSLFTSLGEFPVFLFLLAVGIVLLGMALAFRPSKEETTTPYAGGEEFYFESHSNYYVGEQTVKRAVRLAEGVGAALVLALVAIPLLLGVGL